MDEKDGEHLAELFEQEGNDTQVLTDITNCRLNGLQTARDNIKKAQERQKRNYGKKHASPNAFIVGEKVLRKNFTRKKRAGGEMDTHYVGPYIITKSLGKGIYTLKSEENPDEVLQNVSGVHLKPFNKLSESMDEQQSEDTDQRVSYLIELVMIY